MKIATWNVNGIRAPDAQLHEFLDKEQPDILCLQEIKASTESPARTGLVLTDAVVFTNCG
jgi:exodeoxyribonuclease-3